MLYFRNNRCIFVKIMNLNIEKNMKVKRILNVAIVGMALTMSGVMGTGCSQAPKGTGYSQIVEEGGTGPYKAIMKEDASLQAHTIFVPQDLSAFNQENPLPVLVWGNGACYNSPFEHYLFLNEIASYGYMVVATGYIPKEGVPYDFEMPRSTTEQQIESIDWVIAQNADKNSPYYNKVDINNIALAGMSCGGLQTLYNCADKRIKTMMVCNSGLFNDASVAMPGMPMPDKSKLNEIHTSVMYMLGGKEDIAYGNGMDDFSRINHVPACATNLPVGHGGTYAQPHGGEYGIVAVAWLNWQLKGDKQAAQMFVGDDCALASREGWTIDKNDLFKELK